MSDRTQRCLISIHGIKSIVEIHLGLSEIKINRYVYLFLAVFKTETCLLPFDV